jgi:hypothetical protein
LRQHGVQGPVEYSLAASADEAVFVLTTRGAARMNEPAITRELTDLLNRKVWITTESDIWEGRTALLG